MRPAADRQTWVQIPAPALFNLGIHKLDGDIMEELIQPYEERKLFERLKEYYEKLYPEVKIDTDEEVLSPAQIGDLEYTFPGVEEEATFREKVERIKKAINYGYDTPLIIARKGKRRILLDGHRRAVAAWELGLSWKALVLVFPESVSLGIEKMIQGKLGELFGK